MRKESSAIGWPGSSQTKFDHENSLCYIACNPLPTGSHSIFWGRIK